MIDYCVKSFSEAFEDTDSYGYEYENDDGEIEWDWDEFEYEHYLPQSHIGKDSEITFNYMEDAGLTNVNIHLQPIGNKAWVHLKLIDPERSYYARILFRDNKEVTYSEMEKYIKDWLSEILFNKLEVVEQVVYFNEHDYDEVTESRKRLKRK